MASEIIDSQTYLAEEMAKLTCELAKTCNEKENNFAAIFELTPAEFKCLRLFTEKNVMSIKELTFKLGLTPGRITHILTSLEAKKYIIRKIDPSDKRNIQVYLTSQSEPFIKEINSKHVKIHEDILSKIGEDKQEYIIEAMRELITALHSWNKQVSKN